MYVRHIIRHLGQFTFQDFDILWFQDQISIPVWFWNYGHTYPTSYISAASSCQSKTLIRNKTDAYEVARLLFPGLARPLQKYLRITRQQPWHTMDSILKHLALCIKHECSSKAFLEKYLKTGPVIHVSVESIAHWTHNTASLNPARYSSYLSFKYVYTLSFQNDREKRPVQTWSLVCETQLTRMIKCGTLFQLRQGNDVSLLCQIQQLPHFNITEGELDSIHD